MRKLILLFSLTFLIAGCQSYLFTGKKSVRWENDIAYQTITWDDYASEEDVRKSYNAFVVETLQKLWYKDYILLFQSNDEIEANERTFVIKIFKDETAKNLFLKAADDMVKKSYRLATNSFKARIQQLQYNMPVEDVYRLLPELADYGGKQKFYSDYSRIQLGEWWLAFDFKGYLIDFGQGLEPGSQSLNNEWSF